MAKNRLDILPLGLLSSVPSAERGPVLGLTAGSVLIGLTKKAYLEADKTKPVVVTDGTSNSAANPNGSTVSLKTSEKIVES